MRIVLSLVCWFLLVSAASAASWQEVAWQGEPAWSATQDGWRAIVSAARGRLVFFGPVEGGKNMLFSPRRAPFPQPGDGAPTSWGGHRAWLGPQTAWVPVWPPPMAWEFTPAAAATRGDWLVLTLPVPSGGQPAIERRYRWERGALRCDVSWRDARRPWCAIQIFAVPAAARIEVPSLPSSEWPRGFSLLPIHGRWDIRKQFPLPVCGVTRRGGVLSLVHGKEMQKIGLPPAAIRWSLGGDAVVLERARTVEKGALPDEGALTQVYLGNPRMDESFNEIEQLSSIRTPGFFPARFTVYLSPALSQP